MGELHAFRKISLFVRGLRLSVVISSTLNEFSGEAVTVSGRLFYYKRFIWLTKSWIRLSPKHVQQLA